MVLYCQNLPDLSGVAGGVVFLWVLDGVAVRSRSLLRLPHTKSFVYLFVCGSAHVPVGLPMSGLHTSRGTLGDGWPARCFCLWKLRLQAC